MVVKTVLLGGLAGLLFTSSSAAQGHRGIQRPFVAGDWITACDSTLHCDAFLLFEESPPETAADLAVRISRDYTPGAEAQFTLQLNFADERFANVGGLQLLIDGEKPAGAQDWMDDALFVYGADAVNLIIQMHGGLRLSVVDGDQRVLGEGSLSGLQEVLARMDVKQGRDGTGEALILRGQAVADWTRMAPMTPARPIRVAPRANLVAAIMPRPAHFSRLTEDVACPRPSSARLDAATSLVLINSDCGGYLRQGVLALLDEQGEIVPARFEPFNIEGEPSAPTPRPAGEAILPDPYWDTATSSLVVQRRERAYGHCGAVEQYLWDTVEKQFRLSSYASMPVCRGMRGFIVTYVAQVARPSSETVLESFDCVTESAGLDWGICSSEPLRELAVEIEAKQRELGRDLGKETGDALIADWGLLTSVLRRSLGGRWLDIVAEDVEATLQERRDFLSLIFRRDGLEGHWGNYQTRIRVLSEDAPTTFEVSSPSCDFSMSEGQSPMLERVGDTLRVTIDRADFERRYPSIVGCFRVDDATSVVDGVYFPIAGGS